jgi:hypothetical protein
MLEDFTACSRGWEFVRSLKKMVEVSQWVTREDGGELVLVYEGEDNNNGQVEVKLTLTVLPETISEDAELRLSVDDQELIANVDITFGPHGITFSKPALLFIEAKRLDLSNVDPDRIDFYYYSPDTGQWEKMERGELEVKPSEGYIEVKDAEIPHFSRYAMAHSE